MATVIKPPHMRGEQIEEFNSRHQSTMVDMIDTTLDERADYNSTRISELKFGLYAVTKHLLITGEIQPPSYSLIGSYPWIDEAATDIRQCVAQKFDDKQDVLYIISSLEEYNSPYFGNRYAQKSLHRDLLRRLPMDKSIDSIGFCPAVACGKVQLDFNDLK